MINTNKRRMAKRKTFFTVTVTQGTGNRISRGRFKNKADAKAFIKKLNARTDADTKNPRIKKFLGFK